MRLPPPEIARALHAAAQASQVPYTLLAAVAYTESRYNPRAESSAGAQGLMQLMPSAQQAQKVTDPWDAQQSAVAGARFLRALLRLFADTPTPQRYALAGYNWGPARVKRALQHPDAWERVPASVRRYVLDVEARQAWMQNQAEPAGSTAAERLNNAIVSLAALNPDDPKATALAKSWVEWWNGPRRLIADSALLQHPVLQAAWVAYGRAFASAVRTDSRTPRPDAIEPTLWSEVATKWERRAADAASAASRIVPTVMQGASFLGLAAVLALLVLLSRNARE